jgi:hypothetical protein
MCGHCIMDYFFDSFSLINRMYPVWLSHTGHIIYKGHYGYTY